MGDPWMVQPHEWAKFTEHFERLGPVGGQLSGEQAKKFMLQSQLPPPILGQIWSLADTNVDGKLDFKEFAIACKVINLKLHGMEVPKVLPPSLISSISHIGMPKVMTPPQAQPIAPISSPPMMTSMTPLIPNASLAHVAPLTSTVPPLVSNVAPLLPNVPLIPNSTSGQPPIIPTGSVYPVIGANVSASNIPIGSVAPMTANAPLISSLVTTSAPPLIPKMDPLQSLQNAPVVAAPPAAALARTGSITMSNSQQLLASQTSPPLAGPVTSTPIQQPLADMSPVGVMDPTGIGSPAQLSPEWSVPQAQRLKYTQLFNATDRSKTGAVSGPQARGIMLQSKLPQVTLAKIWALADLDVDGKLGCDEFVLAMYLCEMATRGEIIPAKLPPELVPPTFRRDSSGNLGPSFEDKRRENFVRGQAELDRRRAVLADAHTKEKAERERKEQEEIEKREKIRAETIKREQEELLRKQREEQEKRDAARKEMERQCQLEWEKKRVREAEAKRTALSAEVAALRGGAARRAGAATAARQRAAGLARDIRDTRSKVAELKGVIDGMRSTRDVSIQESTQLKARIKELNAKQIALNQEKAHLDSKARTESSSEDGTFSNMEIVLKQLREKIETAQQVVEAKKVDVDSNNSQLKELNETVSKLREKCEVIWASYEQKKKQYEEKRTAAAAVDMSSAWDSDPAASAWGDSGAWNDTGATEGEDASITHTTSTVVSATSAVDTFAAPAGDTVSRFRCMFEFVARSSDELSLQPGDVVTSGAAPAAGEPGWRWGECRGAQGWYPEAYVEEVQPSSSEIAPLHAELEPTVELKTHLEGIAEVPENVSESSVQAPLEGGEAFIAAYPYTSAEPGDLMFQAGEIIMVTHVSGDWWTGYVADTNRSGIFPSNYVQKYAESKIEPKASTPVSTEVASITEAAAAVVQAADGGGSSVGGRRDSGRDSSLGGRSKKEVAQAIAAYTANGAEQLSLQKGQLILVRKKADSGWWEGELQAKGRSRQIGWFPASYVKVLQSSGRASGRTTPVLSGKMEGALDQVIDKVVALYPYTAQNADELSFDKDDIISVTNRDQDPAWWQGELRGMIGLFPSNYVTKLTHDG